jgi:hypothetical protein
MKRHKNSEEKEKKSDALEDANRVTGEQRQTRK